LREGCLRNRFEIRQITAFWPGQRTRGAGRGLCRWNECEKGGEPGTQGCILSSPDKQNGNPGLGSVTAVLLRNVGESTIATLMRFGLALSIFYIFVGGSIALSSLRTLPTFGYGTGFKIDVKRANAPVEVYIDALLRQEKANQIRQVRNEAAFQALRNGFVLFGIVLILYFLVLAGIIHAGLPIAL
jgi:hypothetical protein